MTLRLSACLLWIVLCQLITPQKRWYDAYKLSCLMRILANVLTLYNWPENLRKFPTNVEGSYNHWSPSISYWIMGLIHCVHAQSFKIFSHWHIEWLDRVRVSHHLSLIIVPLLTWTQSSKVIPNFFKLGSNNLLCWTTVWSRMLFCSWHNEWVCYYSSYLA